MPTLILDPFGGLAGDMFLATLIDLGADVDAIRAALASLDLPTWRLAVEPAERRHLGCTYVRFEVHDEQDHRHLPEILGKIEASSLPARAKARAKASFVALATAEAKVHRIPIDHVHFHEVGAADAILDVCGVAMGLELLEIDDVWCEHLPMGGGTVVADHGEMPCPAPAVVELLAGRFPLVPGGEGEMVTPTGAALLVSVGTVMPAQLRISVERAGYGAGTRRSSVCRGSLVRVTSSAEGATDGGSALEEDEVCVLEAHVDDMTGEEAAFLMERLFAGGALDVVYQPIVMKKGRPALALTCMGRPGDEQALARELFAHSPTLGVRVTRTQRLVRPREVIEVATAWGTVRVKRAGDHMHPEYEDVATLARTCGLAFRTVHDAATEALRRELTRAAD
jgi:uncharacterized protein (TIGR00299 family) protein